MIHKSYPWKTELARDADLIERWAGRPKQSAHRSFLIERKVFLAAYVMRKLDNAVMVSTDLLTKSVPVIRFPSVKAGYSEHNNHRFDKFFDLNRAERGELRGRRLIDLLIHSLVFVEVLGEAETYDGFMVTSDYEQSKGLVQVEAPTFVRLMRQAANDYPTAIRRTRDSKGRLQTWAGNGNPPSD